MALTMFWWFKMPSIVPVTPIGGFITSIVGTAPIVASTLVGVTTISFASPATLTDVHIAGTLDTTGAGLITGNITPA